MKNEMYLKREMFKSPPGEDEGESGGDGGDGGANEGGEVG